ncbi:hypothetical protein K438DRAFT_673546 [Mycena galopus ATCC 62051]|nr:hypothetical protein K438DRAFT_673546 [Mycena galopus ATCC 62051]
MDRPSTGLLYRPAPDEDEFGAPPPGSKRRRLRGACDSCKQRKVRCDSARLPGGVCSNCIAFNSQCTHQGLPKSDGLKNPEHSSESGRSLQTVSEHVDTILAQSTAYIAAQDLRDILLDIARYSRGLEQELEDVKLQLSRLQGSSVVFSPSPPDTNSSNDDSVLDSLPDGVMILDQQFQDMSMADSNFGPFFYGRSSGFYLIQTAQALKAEHDVPNVQQPAPTRRREFWHSDWEVASPPPPLVYNFPPKDLLDRLVSIYFDRVNVIIPCLHRPTFERSLSSGLHLIEDNFAGVVLAVAALASRYCDDPRVIFEGTNSKLSSGWQWFRQIRYPSVLRFDLTLHDLQRMFFRSSISRALLHRSPAGYSQQLGSIIFKNSVYTRENSAVGMRTIPISSQPLRKSFIRGSSGCSFVRTHS